MTKTTLIGAIYTVISLLSIPTFILPMLTMIPLALPLELIFGKIFGQEDYSKIGNSVIICLVILCLTTTYLFYKRFTKDITDTGKVNTLLFIIFLSLQLLIIHPLFFYLDSSRDWHRASDGQFIFGITKTYPISSAAFMIFGVLTDLYRNSMLTKLTKENFLEQDRNVANRGADQDDSNINVT